MSVALTQRVAPGCELTCLHLLNLVLDFCGSPPRARYEAAYVLERKVAAAEAFHK